MKFVLLVAMILLSGCVTSGTYSDMTNNNFVAVSPVAPPVSLTGHWSGSMGPYLSTMRVNKDGTGNLCSSWSTDINRKIKYDGHIFRVSDGSWMNIDEHNANKLNLSYRGIEYKLYKDDSLSEASPYCAEQLR